MTQTKKCVIVLSGGPDSATVAYWAKKQGYQIYPITFNYGQIAVKETEAAQKIAEKLDTTTKIIDLSALKEIFSNVTSLCNTNIPLTSEFSAQSLCPFETQYSFLLQLPTPSQSVLTQFFMEPKAQTNPSTPIAGENSMKPSRKPQDWAHAKKLLSKHPLVVNTNQSYSRREQS